VASIRGVHSINNMIDVQRDTTWTYYDPYVYPNVLPDNDDQPTDRTTLTSDADIAEDIESQFFWSPFVDSDDINVSVDAGVARLTGTVFIKRDRREARAQTAIFAERLGLGHRLLFFPEGSSTDGMRVLLFKSTLFESFFNLDEAQPMQVQPVTLIYDAPSDQDRRFYGWWGDMSFGGHLVQVLGAPRQGGVTVLYHAPLRVADFTDRKTLAAAAEAAVRSGMPQERRGV